MEGMESPQVEPTQENASTIFLERMNNPEIKAQLVAMYEEAYALRAQDGKTTRSPVIDLATGDEKRDEEGAYILEETVYVPPSREEIERMVDERINEVLSVTEIGYLPENVIPSNEVMNLNWKLPLNGQSPTTAQWSIIEGHEKGHNVRQFGHVDVSEYFKERYTSCFDIGNMEFNDAWYEQLRKENPDMTYEEAKEAFIATMTEPAELAERMGQLKNYFGMRAAEPFTKAHLDYARAHYVADTGFDNFMSPFFQGITPDKEEEFLALMNMAGI